MIEVLYTDFYDTLSNEVWNRYFCKMPEAIQERINRFRRWQDRKSVLLGKVLLMNGLMGYGYPHDCLQRLSYTKYNRPFIDNSIDFNIAHSEEYVVCALTDKGRVGIDIEKIKLIELEDFKDHITFEQWKTIKESPNQLKKFYELWTVLESVIKADGKGMSIPLLDIHTDGKEAIVYDNIWYVTTIDIDPFYSCHISTDVEKVDIKIRKVNLL